MKLTFSPASPFVRKVRVMLHETGLSGQVIDLPVVTSVLETDPVARNANPLGKIPALVLDNGTTLFDSRVICRYFDDLSGVGLYPKNRLWDTLTLEALADGIMESAVHMVYETRLRPEGNRSEDWVEAQWGKIVNVLDALEERKFSAMNDPLNFGQLSIACALGYLDFRHKKREWRKGRESISTWNESFQERPSLKDTVPTN